MSKHKHPHYPRGGQPPRDQNEGEGNRTAARSYNDHLQSFISDKKVEPAAREAKAYVDRHPGEASEAEARAKAGPKPIRKRIEDLVEEGRSMWHRAKERWRMRRGG